MIRPILLLGDARLVAPCRQVRRSELEEMEALGADLRDTLLAFRREHGVGRGIAAPQIGASVRCVHEIDHLDGTLAVARAIDPQAFALRRQLEAAGELPRRGDDR